MHNSFEKELSTEIRKLETKDLSRRDIKSE